MQLISPEVLAAAKGLSPGAAGFLLFVGFLLWAFGWRWQKFWVVFGITTAAGVLGLSAGKAAGGQVLAIGVLLAFAGGVMALEVAKILAFVAGGVGAWLAAQSVLPAAQELWAVFLAGGLFGVILYRLWTMLLTSFAGVLVSWHAALVLSGPAAKFDAVAWIGEHTAAVNGAVLVVTVLGVLMQTITAPGPAEPKAEKPEKKPKEKKADAGGEKKDAGKSASWWRPAAAKAA
jgi:hypothetical protein